MHKTPSVYLQRHPMTCGPSCVMMAESTLRNTLLEQSDELRIWERTRTNRGNYTYTTHPRLAVELMERGFRTELWHTYEDGFRRTPSMPHWEFRRKMKYYAKYWAEAKQHGMTDRIFSFASSDIARAVQNEGTVAVVLTRYSGNVFHHRLVYDATDVEVAMVCPILGKLHVSYEELDSMMQLPYGKGALIVRR